MKLRKWLSLLLALAVLTGAAGAAAAQDALAEAARYIAAAVPSPQVGSTGGEWAVLGLVRSGAAVPEGYYAAYYAAVEARVKDCGGQLHARKYTEYSRVILALSALGYDARDVAGYDLTKPLGDYDKTIWQGINGPIWALIALDSRDYPMPENPEAETQATRQLYIDRILACQLSDGGWSLDSQGTSDPDITGMALQALAKYQDQPAVKKATDAALTCVSRMQGADGGFAAWGTESSESCVQMLVALCELGIPLDDTRFVKGGRTLLDGLLAYRVSGGGFRHTAADAGANLMASEQALCALAAVRRAGQGQSSLYRMDDVPAAGGAASTPARHPDVQAVPETQPGKTFADVSGADRTAVEALAARGILSGMDDGLFHPGEHMSRAQFAAAVVRALGLQPKAAGTFTDVTADKWYAAYVGAASACGVITGVGNGKFNPSGTITRQEAAVMVARAARLCGLDTELDERAVRNVLAQFGDYMQTPDWARQGLAFCCRAGILDDTALEIRGTELVQRGEIARMLYRLLDAAGLL